MQTVPIGLNGLPFLFAVCAIDCANMCNLEVCMEKQWWKEAVVYQIYPRSFKDSNGDGIGDIQGIISKLDYLKLLGIDVIWLCPVFQSPNDDNGYDISNYCQIMDEFGTMQDWESLLFQVHQRGMKLIMDLVVNHTSDEHLWFVESRSSLDNPYRDYYIWRQGEEGKEPNNWESCFSGSAWKYDEATKEYYLHLFSSKQPDLNWENPNVRGDIYSMMRWWLEKGIDGFRMDVINFISKAEALPNAKQVKDGDLQPGNEHFMNGPRVHEYLQEMNDKVLRHYDILTVGEMPGVTPEEATQYTAPERKELNMVFQFDHVDIDSGPKGKWDVKPWKLTDLKRILTKWQTELHEKGWNSLYLNNHDQPRMVSRFGNDKKYRMESAKMLATMLHTMQGTPYIYQGEEIGMTNVQFPSIADYKDIETINMFRDKSIHENLSEKEILTLIYQKGRDNARTPMQWDDTYQAGFTDGTPWIKVNPNYKEINVKESLLNVNSIFHYYKTLIELRKQYLIMVYGDFRLLLEDNESVFAYVRSYDRNKLLVLLNFTEVSTEVELNKNLFETTKSKLLIGNYEEQETLTQLIQLRPFEARVYLA